MVKLILMLITLKPKNQYFKGYLMLETLLNYLGVLIILETSLDLLVLIVLLVSFTFVADLFDLNLQLILKLLHSIMLLKRSFIE
jgi:hypothetical protein